MKVYEKIYDYFVSDMRSGQLKAGDRMPSLRKCQETLSVSRTSAETAYMQLAADGYIYSVEKVGFYVTDLAGRYSDSGKEKSADEKNKLKTRENIIYDLETIGADKEVSILDLWRRYMKSALRQEERLLSYAGNQGEYDLRFEIAAYVRKNRNIICSPEDIVIGAGFQSLLSILIALIPGERSISFPTRSFTDCAETFSMAGFEVAYRNKASHVIYVTPSWMTKWGDVMTMKRRKELIEHARTNGHLIIEDDYQNEFVFSSRPTPSLYAMNGGEDTAFLGSFSRVLLPSVRISYLILPKGVRAEYEKIKKYYNQTASKAEQIALTQFLRDGHLQRHIRKMRRLYVNKRAQTVAAIKKSFPSNTQIKLGNSGMEIGLILNGKNLMKKLEKSRVAVTPVEADEKSVSVLISCSAIPGKDIKSAIEMLARDLYPDKRS